MIDDSKYDIPGINWLASVLARNIGHNEWVEMTPEEFAEHKAQTGSDYPFGVVNHPIPDSTNVISLEQGKHVAAFGTPGTKKLFLDLAKRYIEMEREYYRAMGEMGAEKWNEVVPKNTPCDMANHGIAGGCSHGRHACFIASPALQFVCFNGVARGFYRCNRGGGGPDKPGHYYAVVGGKSVVIQPSHWREVPPPPPGEVKYEELKDEVNRIKKEAGMECAP